MLPEARTDTSLRLGLREKGETTVSLIWGCTNSKHIVTSSLAFLVLLSKTFFLNGIGNKGHLAHLTPVDLKPFLLGYRLAKSWGLFHCVQQSWSFRGMQFIGLLGELQIGMQLQMWRTDTISMKIDWEVIDEVIIKGLSIAFWVCFIIPACRATDCMRTDHRALEGTHKAF